MGKSGAAAALLIILTSPRPVGALVWFSVDFYWFLLISIKFLLIFCWFLLISIKFLLIFYWFLLISIKFLLLFYCFSIELFGSSILPAWLDRFSIEFWSLRRRSLRIVLYCTVLYTTISRCNRVVTVVWMRCGSVLAGNRDEQVKSEFSCRELMMDYTPNDNESMDKINSIPTSLVMPAATTGPWF